MEHKSGLCHLSDDKVIPDMEWDECPACGELAIDPVNSEKASNYFKHRGKALLPA